MFSNIGWGEMAILVIAALVILGPERLPSAMSWVAKTLKQVREYATGAQSQLKEELGPEFEDLKKPFDELRGMRGMTPRGVITKHLLDGDDSYFTGNFDSKPASPGPAQSAGSQGGAPGSAPGGAGQAGPGPSSSGPESSGPPTGPTPGPTRYDSEAT